jgi:hypothetical protein
MSAYLNALMEEASRETLLTEIAKLYDENVTLRADLAKAVGNHAADLSSARSESVHSVPAGWKLVPLEPTPEMTTAAREQLWDTQGGVVKVIYRAMIAAAPEAPK